MTFSPKRFGHSSGVGSSGTSSGGTTARTVRFTAVGGEVAAVIPLGFTMPSANYNISVSQADVAFYLTDLAFPRAQRTTTQFQMLCPAGLTAGDKFDFSLVPI
jgi:hypothetical protein